MGARSVLVLSLLCVWGAVRAEEGAADEYKAPDFCGTYECPKYEVAKKYETFELRTYQSTLWVTTSLELDYFGFGIYRSFKRLFDYINGQNSEGIKIKMTVPVRIYVPLITPTDKNATMSFFVPLAVVNPPQPLNKEVYIESFPQMSFYVKSFGGYALKTHYEKKAKMLSEELTAMGLGFDSTFGTAAGYNDPLTFVGRHNEVWYTVQ
ncbi:heme-binding protein 2-like [Pelobates fuscus]|uniref:heme-binding protein 2-like n=1 Tax=Pelobates fuscus TaxID=191477 RepID=UPI002FE47D26